MSDYRSFVGNDKKSITTACLVDNTHFLLAGAGKRVSLHNLEDQGSINFPKVKSSVDAADVSYEGQFCAAASMDVITMFDLVKQTAVRSIFSRSSSEKTEAPRAFRILDCKILNPHLMASCGVNHRLDIYDLRDTSRGPVGSFEVGDDNLNSLDYNRDPTNSISVGSSNGNLYSLDLRIQQIITDTIPSDDSSVMNVSRRGQDLALVSFSNGTINLFDTQRGTSLTNLSILENATQLNYKLNAEFIESSNTIVNGTEDGTVQIWDLNQTTYHARKRRILNIESTSSEAANVINIVRYDKENNRLVATSATGMIHIWDRVL